MSARSISVGLSDAFAKARGIKLRAGFAAALILLQPVAAAWLVHSALGIKSSKKMGC